MGDMGDAFRDMKAAKDKRKDARALVNVDSLRVLGVPAREQSKNVFRVDTEWGAVMYYPSSNSWQHKGKTHRGTVNQFAAWLIEKGLL